MIMINFNMSMALPEAILPVKSIKKCKNRAQKSFLNLLYYNQSVRQKGCCWM